MIAWLALLGPAGLLAAVGGPGNDAEVDLKSVLVVCTATDMYPYSYFEEGEPRGFAVELGDALARTMNLRIRRLPVNNTEVGRALVNREVAVAQFWTDTPERRQIADFSVPVLLLQTVIVVRQDERRIKSIADLRGMIIATGSPGSVASTFVREQVPEAKLINTDRPQEVLTAVSTGAADAAVLSRLTAQARIERLGLKNLRVLEVTIKGYDVRYCFAVRRGETVLLARLNEGLAILHRNGEFDRIYGRWFGRHEPLHFTREQMISSVAAALALGFIWALAAMIRQRKLSHRIASQAAEIVEQRSLHTALFDNHPMATIVLEAGTDGAAPQMLSLNGEAAKICGIDLARSTGQPLDCLSFAPEIRRYFDGIVARWPQQGRGDHYEEALRDSQRLLETSLVPIAPSPAGTKRLCVLSADVTKRRLADREVAQSRRMRALGELVGGIAHEFNNLLTPVLIHSSVLRQTRAGDAELVAKLKLIEQATQRSADLTRRLLAFGRRSDDSAGSVDLASALENCMALLRPTFDRRLAWHTEVPPGLPPVSCDSTDLHQIAFNLVINARDTLMDRLAQAEDASGWKPQLTVTVRNLPPGARVPRLPRPEAELLGWQELIVEDNGLGIPPENLDRIFEPFFTTKEIGKGTGLGLATVWHLVNDAGGITSVGSVVGEGTRFHVTLPAWSAGPPRAAAVVERPASLPARLSVLLVEDELIVANATASLLVQLGHSVRQLPDGQAAWEDMVAHGSRYDVLLVDINMPRMSGVDFVRRVRETAYAGRIVVMSGRVAESDMRALESLRIDHMLIKPFTDPELTEALR